MKKIFVILVLLLCCVGCSSNSTVEDNYDSSMKAFNETIYGHNDKDVDDAMTVDEALSLINNAFNYNTNDDYSIEYYDMVKFTPDKVENDYYAFLVVSNIDKYSYYVLVDIYNGVTTFVTAEDIGIDK